MKKFFSKKSEIQPNKKDGRKIVNKPEARLGLKPLTKEEFSKHVKKRVSKISEEFRNGFKFLQGMERTVTVFGSARFKPGNPHYDKARELGQRVSQYGFGMVTGGGPGIMEAGNRGAYETNGESLGLNIELPHEQATNPYMNRTLEFEYFFSRKVLMSYAAEAYIFFPGGFGTLDEFFEMLTLIQTNKIEPVPVICVGTDYWNPLQTFIEEHLYEEHKAINKTDMNLYTITDDLDEVMDIILRAPIRRQD